MGRGFQTLPLQSMRRYSPVIINKVPTPVFDSKLVPQKIHSSRSYFSSVELRYSGALQEDKERNNAQEVRVESSQSRAWTAMLEAPLWTAPWCQPLTPPTTGCAGRPLPLWTSCLVLAGRSPGLEEPPLYNQFPSPPFLSVSLSLFFFLFHTSSHFLSCFCSI